MSLFPRTAVSRVSRDSGGIADSRARGWEELSFFYRFGFGGIDSPEFRAARIAACRFAGMEDMAKRYEEYKAEGEMAVAVE